jgi:uncharacterized protein (TIGR03083 family)
MISIPPRVLGAPPVAAAAARVLTRPGGHRPLRHLDLPAKAAFGDFLQALAARDADERTACEGWTVHELLAHLAAGSAEIADLARALLHTDSAPPTRGFEEREAPYRDLDPRQLRRRFVVEAIRATAAVMELDRAGRSLPFTGVDLTPASLVAHAEAELVLHRWDLTGDDDTSVDALSSPAMLQHAVTVVSAMRPHVMPFQLVDGAGLVDPVVLRAEGQPDVLLHGRTLTLGTDPAAEVVTFHPAGRVLAIWGRNPTGRIQPMRGHPDTVAATLGVLAPATR